LDLGVNFISSSHDGITFCKIGVTTTGWYECENTQKSQLFRVQFPNGNVFYGFRELWLYEEYYISPKYASVDRLIAKFPDLVPDLETAK
jgi:hypothetical protein